MLIPALIARHRSSALGLCGATSMDFTLPVLQRAGGTDIVPAAIVHGFIMSLAAPVLVRCSQPEREIQLLMQFFTVELNDSRLRFLVAV